MLLFHDQDSLWRSNGTGAGTLRLADFGESVDSSSVGRVEVVAETLFFIAPAPTDAPPSGGRAERPPAPG